MIVTGIGRRTEWLWSSSTAARSRLVGNKWSPKIFDGGATLFECLTRKRNRHRIKRIVSKPGEWGMSTNTNS